MPMPPRSADLSPSPWLYRSLAGLLIFGAAFAHIAYLFSANALDLAPDEAHYWDWSRHLDWSYYSKGPLVAYLIRGSCELFGSLSMHWAGNLMPAIRLPAVLCGSLLLVSVYVLTVQVFQREALALGTVALALTLPIITAGSTLMTIDSPYTCCWGWALVLCHHAIFSRSTWAWALAGVLIGLGVLAKYTMILFVPSVGLFLLFTPAFRHLLWRPGFWIMTLVTALFCLPIVVWNFEHKWVTFFHVQALGGVNQTKIYWLGPIVYIGGQFALLLGFWFIAWVSAMVDRNPLRECDPKVGYLWWLSAPMFGLFLTFSLTTGGGELNWPVTAYISGLVLTGPWLTQRLRTAVGWDRRLFAGSLAFCAVLGLSGAILLHCSSVIHPLLLQITGPEGVDNRMPLRKVDPTCRLKGWRLLAEEVDRLRRECEARGEVVEIVGSNWSLPGELGVYCAGHPQAYSLGDMLQDRHSQYDFWPGPGKERDLDLFKGKTFIAVNVFEKDVATLAPAFDQIEPARIVEYREGGQVLSLWSVTVCRGYKGGVTRGGPQFH